MLLLLLLAVVGGCATHSPYREKLLLGAEYAPEAVPDEIAKKISFSYQPADAVPLAALRERIPIPPRRADEEEAAYLIRLTDLVHRLVPWDGSAPWPDGTLSTDTILNHTAATGGGVNCRMLAIVLQEIFLAAGYPARMVSCIPLDPEDRDSHVIVSVWSREQNRWLWMDPSFNAYVTDSAGQLAGIEEVRQGLIEGASFSLNPEANIRGRRLSEDFYFATYMTKNLYAFISPLEAAWGYEGSPGSRFSAMLVPATEYDRFINDSGSTVRRYRFRESDWIQYIISDPGLFWQPPPDS